MTCNIHVMLPPNGSMTYSMSQVLCNVSTLQCVQAKQQVYCICGMSCFSPDQPPTCNNLLSAWCWCALDSLQLIQFSLSSIKLVMNLQGMSHLTIQHSQQAADGAGRSGGKRERRRHTMCHDRVLRNSLVCCLSQYACSH